MADVTLTVQVVSRPGLNLTGAVTTVVIANTYYFANDGKTKLYVKNATGSTCIVTVDTPNSVDGDLAIPQRTISIATAKEYMIGTFPPSDYNDTSGRVKISFDQTVDIVAVRG